MPITDLTIKENDLVVATQGRAFWVIDDLTVVQQMNSGIAGKSLHLFPVDTSYRMQGPAYSFPASPRNAGANPPIGAVINFFVKEAGDSTKGAITIFDKNKNLVRSFATDAKEPAKKMELTKGMNQAVWNFRYPEAETVDGMILWNGVPAGIVAPPGNYFARVKVGLDSAEVPFTVKPDPTYKMSLVEYEQQFLFLKTVQDKFNETQKAIKDIRSLRTQITEFVSRQGKEVPAEIKAAADSLTKHLSEVEETLYQTKAKSSQDVLNFPIRLNDKLAGLFDVANSGNFPPSKQAREVYADLALQIDGQLARFKTLKEKEVPAFNQLIREKALPVIKPATP